MKREELEVGALYAYRPQPTATSSPARLLDHRVWEYHRTGEFRLSWNTRPGVRLPRGGRTGYLVARAGGADPKALEALELPVWGAPQDADQLLAAWVRKVKDAGNGVRVDLVTGQQLPGLWQRVHEQETAAQKEAAREAEARSAQWAHLSGRAQTLGVRVRPVGYGGLVQLTEEELVRLLDLAGGGGRA